jgi:acyl-coenzyme A thioesterase PaaI-like protein
MLAPPLDVPLDWTRVEPFPRDTAAKSFVSGDPAGDRLRVAYFRIGDEAVLRAKVWFGPGTEGPPGYAHGGAVAAALDEAVGAAAWMQGHRVLVARLAVDFRNLVPLGIDATIESSIVSIEGRKVTCRARLSANGATLAEAEGLCVVISSNNAGGSGTAPEAS